MTIPFDPSDSVNHPNHDNRDGGEGDLSPSQVVSIIAEQLSDPFAFGSQAIEKVNLPRITDLDLACYRETIMPEILGPLAFDLKFICDLLSNLPADLQGRNAECILNANQIVSNAAKYNTPLERFPLWSFTFLGLVRAEGVSRGLTPRDVSRLCALEHEFCGRTDFVSNIRSAITTTTSTLERALIVACVPGISGLLERRPDIFAELVAKHGLALLRADIVLSTVSSDPARIARINEVTEIALRGINDSLMKLYRKSISQVFRQGCRKIYSILE